jgi:hypothetical protein
MPKNMELDQEQMLLSPYKVVYVNFFIVEDLLRMLKGFDPTSK